MKVLINRCGRRLGIPGRPAIILNANEYKPVSDDDIKMMMRNRTIKRRLDAGAIAIVDESQVGGATRPEDATPPPQPRRPARPRRQLKTRVNMKDKREEVVLPDGVTGKGVEMHHKGGGWYEVWVNGFKVTDTNVRKDRAKEIAADFE